MACYIVTGIAIIIFALGLEATALREQNGNMRDGRFLTRREASPNPLSFLNSADIQSLKKILAFIETAVHQDANAQQINTQQILASASRGSMQGPSRYDEMMKQDREMQQVESKFYDTLQAMIASSIRPGSGGGGSFGGGR